MPKIVMEDIKFNKNPVRKLKKEEREENSIIKTGEDTEIFSDEKILPDIKEKRKRSSPFSSFKRRMRQTPQVKHPRRTINKALIFLFLLVTLFGVFFWGGNLLHFANFTITSKHETITYKNKLFSASKNGQGSGVDFEIMITSNKKEKDFILSETKEVSNKASGVITLYNEFSTKPERLLAGSYIVDSEGKTYRLNKTISIPGYKMDNKKIIPGQINTEITSFLAGESYNGSPDKFYINSFKGTTKYSKIYGRLDKPLVGGVQGLVYFITKDDKEELNKIAESSFKDDLFKQVEALTPPGYILYPGAINFSYKINYDVLSENPATKIEMEGVLTAVLIKKDNFVKNIIKVSLPSITEKEKNGIKILNTDNLIFSFENKQQIISKETTNLSFYINGEVEAIWQPDTESLKEQLLGIHKNQVLEVFHQDRGVSKAIVKIFPPWKKFIPNNPLKINIIVK